MASLLMILLAAWPDIKVLFPITRPERHLRVAHGRDGGGVDSSKIDFLAGPPLMMQWLLVGSRLRVWASLLGVVGEGHLTLEIHFRDFPPECLLKSKVVVAFRDC